MEPWSSLETRNGALEQPGSSKWSPGAPWTLEMEPWSTLEVPDTNLVQFSCSELEREQHLEPLEARNEALELLET